VSDGGGGGGGGSKRKGSVGEKRGGSDYGCGGIRDDNHN